MSLKLSIFQKKKKKKKMATKIPCVMHQSSATVGDSVGLAGLSVRFLPKGSAMDMQGF